MDARVLLGLALVLPAGLPGIAVVVALFIDALKK